MHPPAYLIYRVQRIVFETVALDFEGQNKENHQPCGVDLDLHGEIASGQTTYEATMPQDGKMMPRAEVVTANHCTRRLWVRHLAETVTSPFAARVGL